MRADDQQFAGGGSGLTLDPSLRPVADRLAPSAAVWSLSTLDSLQQEDLASLANPGLDDIVDLDDFIARFCEEKTCDILPGVSFMEPDLVSMIHGPPSTCRGAASRLRALDEPTQRDLARALYDRELRDIRDPSAYVPGAWRRLSSSGRGRAARQAAAVSVAPPRSPVAPPLSPVAPPPVACPAGRAVDRADRRADRAGVGRVAGDGVEPGRRRRPWRRRGVPSSRQSRRRRHHQRRGVEPDGAGTAPGCARAGLGRGRTATATAAGRVVDAGRGPLRPHGDSTTTVSRGSVDVERRSNVAGCHRGAVAVPDVPPRAQRQRRGRGRSRTRAVPRRGVPRAGGTDAEVDAAVDGLRAALAARGNDETARASGAAAGGGGAHLDVAEAAEIIAVLGTAKRCRGAALALRTRGTSAGLREVRHRNADWYDVAARRAGAVGAGRRSVARRAHRHRWGRTFPTRRHAAAARRAPAACRRRGPRPTARCRASPRGARRIGRAATCEALLELVWRDAPMPVKKVFSNSKGVGGPENGEQIGPLAVAVYRTRTTRRSCARGPGRPWAFPDRRSAVAVGRSRTSSSSAATSPCCRICCSTWWRALRDEFPRFDVMIVFYVRMP